MKNTVCANDITIHGIASLFGITVVVINYIHMLFLCSVISHQLQISFFVIGRVALFWTQGSVKVYDMKMLRRVQYFMCGRM